MSPLRKFLRRTLLACARFFGSDITDFRTGKRLGRALLLPWKGRVLVIGAECELWVPAPLPQPRLVYWKQEIGFTVREDELPERKEPALSLLANSPFRGRPPRPLLVALDHRPARETSAG